MSDFALPPDGLLTASAPGDLHEAVRGWLPIGARPLETEAGRVGAIGDRARLEIGPRGAFGLHRSPPAVSPTLRIGAYGCYVTGSDELWIGGPHAVAAVEPLCGRARVELDAPPRAELFAALSLASALLLAARGRLLMHCGAVRAPDGGVWLLAGDSRSGKTSTALGLARAGWALLADDHVVLHERGDELHVAGWLRPLHPDAGWREGVLTGRRVELDPRAVAGLSVVPEGPLAGVLLPQIARGAARTTLRSAAPSEAMAALLRQGAWSLVQPSAARRVLGLLSRAAALPCAHAALAPDSYRSPELMARLLGSVLERRARGEVAVA